MSMRDPAAGRPGVAWLGPVAVMLGTLALLPRPAHATPAVQTFGPGKVSCQPLYGTHMDCLLSASRVTDGHDVTTFDVTLLPTRQQALFRRWCVAGTDACTVTVAGRREAPQSTRLSSVTSVRWTRRSAPGNEAAARAAAAAPSGGSR